MKLLLLSGEELPVPPTVRGLRQPKMDEVLSLLNTYVFLPRYEKCYRLLQMPSAPSDASEEPLVEVADWSAVQANATLTALTYPLSSAHVACTFGVTKLLQPAVRRRSSLAPASASGRHTVSSPSSATTSRPNSPGQDGYSRYLQHLADYAAAGATPDQLHQAAAVQSSHTQHNRSPALLGPLGEHHSSRSPQGPPGGSLVLGAVSSSCLQSSHPNFSVTSQVFGPMSSSGLTSWYPQAQYSSSSASLVVAGGIADLTSCGSLMSVRSSTTSPETNPASMSRANSPGAATVVAPAMHRSAISLVSAIARDRGAGLIEAMHDIIDERERDEAVRQQKSYGASGWDRWRSVSPPSDGSGMMRVQSRTQSFLPSAEGAQEELLSAKTLAPPLAEEEQLFATLPSNSVRHLTDMGFSLRCSCRALLGNRGDVAAAVAFLLHISPQETEKLNLPLTAAEMQRYHNQRGGSATPGVAVSSSSPPVVPPTTTSASSSATSAERQRRAEFVKLLDMGFRSQDARFALRACGGNFNEACAALLGDPGASIKLRNYRTDSHRNWYEPIETMVRNYQLDPQHVVDVTQAVTQDPQHVLLLWYCHHYGYCVSRMASVFSAGQPSSLQSATHPHQSVVHMLPHSNNNRISPPQSAVALSRGSYQQRTSNGGR